MDPRHIVALEIGSSKIKGTVAAVGEFGDIKILAVEEIRVNNCVRHGRIQNVQEVSTHVNSIIRKLENNPAIAPRKVTGAFIAIGGRSLGTVMATAQAKFPNAVEISADTIMRLKRDASFGLVTDKEILGMEPNAFYVDNSEVKNIVGTVGTNVRAQFSAIVIGPATKRNIELIKFDGRSITTRLIVRPTALAALVLTPTERQLGCALVDLGAETSTIAVYRADVLQAIVTLPIGSRNITRDLMTGLSMTEESAEMAKNRIGCGAQADNASDSEVMAYINARAGEIVANILHQLDTAGFKPAMLPAGIILTGGGARLKNIARLIENQAKMPVRTAAVDSLQQFKTTDIDRNANIDILATVKAAAEQHTDDCLTPAPQPQDEPRDEQQYANPHEPVQPQGHRRRRVDDDNLLGDDDDIDREPDFDDYQPYDDPGEEDEENDRSRRKSFIENLKERMTNFWANSPEEDDDDDLDAPTR